MTTQATVIIPTYNRAAHLARALDALSCQDAIGAFDVIVIDDGSTDATATVLAAPRPYRLMPLQQENAGPGPARNRGIEASSSRYIVFVDDDVIPAPDLVGAHVEAQSVREGVVIGRLLSPARRQPAWAEWECRTLEQQYSRMERSVFEPTARQFYTANASVPREALVRAGLFDARYRRAEDVELAYRLEDMGLPFTFAPQAVVEHDTPRSFDAWRRVAEQYGAYDVQMWRDGRTEILRNMSGEFRWWRNPATRVLSRAVVGRPILAATHRLLGGLALRGLSATGPRRLALAACGAYFNALYLDAACEALGAGRAGFWRTLADELDRPKAAAPAAIRS